jgi:hypothetical protein
MFQMPVPERFNTVQDEAVQQVFRQRPHSQSEHQQAGSSGQIHVRRVQALAYQQAERYQRQQHCLRKCERGPH